MNYSRQREAIMTNLAQRRDHPTAEMVYRDIREKYPSVSLGTVYRNLNVLADLGKVLRFSCGDGTDHFDANTSPHYHLICRKCGRVIDLDLDVDPNELMAEARKNYEGTIEGFTVVFQGLCPYCAAEPEADKN